jgi:chemotaxis protein histidine kinase CheA
MGVVLGSPVVDSPAAQGSQPAVPTTTASNEATPPQASDQSSPETQASAAPNSSQQPDTPSSSRTQQSSSDLLAERMARLVKQKKEKDQEKEKESKGKGKAPAESSNKPASPAPTSSVPTADMKYAQMQKKRQQEEKDERARILKRVEDDKAQRRQDAAERKAKTQANAAPASESTGLSSNRSNHPAKQSAECAVQVRLFDGSTIRSRFPSKGNLRANVRPWIDEKQEGGIPYGFKQVLTPLPNKNISISEEEETLQELGLTPSATLILMPINDYASAYEGGGATGLVYKSAAAGYNLVSSGVGMVTGVLGSLLGGGAAAPAQEQQQTPAATTTSSSSINVRTLRDQQRPDDQQFYNGNAVS